MGGEAEAEALRKREMVEVDMLKLKAEAYKEYGQAALAIKMIETMPELAQAISAPLSQTEKIVFMGGDGNGGGPSSMVSDMAKSTQIVNETLSTMTGVGLEAMLKGEAELPGMEKMAGPMMLASLASSRSK